MQNLRLYGEETVYMSEKNTHEYPTVSYVEDTKKVFYQSKPNYVRAKMIVESTDGLTPYIGSSFDLTQMEYIEVTYEDGTTEKVNMSVEPTSYYTFTQTGDVVVDIYLKKDWNNASYMFACNTEIIPVSEIDFTHCKTNKVTDMSHMFNNVRQIACVGAIPGILENIIFGNNFDTSKVTSMDSMFFGCTKLTSLDLSNFDTSNVTNMGGMFSGCTNLTSLDLSNFDTSKVTDMYYMFRDCSGLTTFKYFKKTPSTAIGIPTEITSVDFSSWDTSNVTSMRYLFASCTALTSVTFGENFDTSNITDMYGMFSGWYVSKINALIPRSLYSNKTNYGGLFNGVNFDEPLDLSSLNTSHVTSMSGMFSRCVNLFNMSQVIGFDSFDTSNVTDMSGMFIGCTNLTSLDLSNFDTSKVTDMRYMFRECSGLTSIDLSSFDTSNVTDMVQMFHYCSGLTSLDLSSFDMSNVTDMGSMFTYCSKLTSITFGSQADVSKVTSYSYMFGSITTSGTLYYPTSYADAWNNIIVTHQSTSKFPSKWTATAIDYENE